MATCSIALASIALNWAGASHSRDEDWCDWELPDGTPCQVPAWVKPERDGDRWVIRSKTGRVIAAMPDGSLYFEATSHPFVEQDDLDHIPEAMDENMWCAIASPPGPLADGTKGERFFVDGARQLRESTDRAVIGLFGGNLLEMGQFLYRNDVFLTRLASHADRTHAFLDRVVEMHLENLERFLGLVGPYIDVILFGDDLGMQFGPQISPDMYREFFKPRHALLWNRAKELAGVKVMLHCCGGVRELLPDLIEAGLDAINPVQISCRGMEAKSLKADFGNDLVFWGRRLRHAAHPARSHAGGSREAREGTGSNTEPRGRIRLPAGPQHPC